MFHAVVRIDHQSAQVMQFDADHVQTQKLKTHSRHTSQHGSKVRSEHEFYAEVCNALAGISEVLMVGPKIGLADFRHYVEKHRVPLNRLIVDWEVQERATDNQMVAMARQYFVKYDRMAGTPTPT